VEVKWKEIYNSEEDMKIMYNGWERWITTTGRIQRLVRLAIVSIFPSNW
jgi:hypothetical protein